MEKNTKRNTQKDLKIKGRNGIVSYCDILFILVPGTKDREPKDHKGGASDMNKYELAVVVNAKIEDDARAGVIEKVKALITRFGGNVTDIDEWGKKRLAYEIRR